MTECPRCHTPLEASDLRCSICALAVAREADGGAGPSGLRARILRCRECAAAVSYSAAAQAPQCGFCGAVMEVEQPEDPIEAAQWLVPFSVDHEGAARALRAWLGSRGWFRPRDLSAAAAIHTMRPLHWSAWVFDADASVTWAADSDMGSGRSAWAPHAGSAGFEWRGILIPASRGLREPETARLAPGYAMDRAVPIAQAGQPLEGGAIEAFDVQRSAARRRIADAIESMAVADLQARGHIPGRRFRNVHASVLLSRLVTRRFVLPAWVAAYRYRGAVYRTIVHGQEPSIVLGEAPISWSKVALLVGLALAVLLVILLLVGTR
ncbi:MAG TPA: hypothetical protein VKB80_04780 [Kofleriaceae bacterium]|nr:hypothetical protein [Kofleriaceae bacterium]